MLSTFEILSKYLPKMRKYIDGKLFDKAFLVIEIFSILLILLITLFLSNIFLNVNLKSTKFIYFETLYYLNIISEKNNANLIKINKILKDEIINTVQKIFSKAKINENQVHDDNLISISSLKANIRNFIEMQSNKDYKNFSNNFIENFITEFKNQTKLYLENQFDEEQEETNSSKEKFIKKPINNVARLGITTITTTAVTSFCGPFGLFIGPIISKPINSFFENYITNPFVSQIVSEEHNKAREANINNQMQSIFTEENTNQIRNILNESLNKTVNAIKIRFGFPHVKFDLLRYQNIKQQIQ